MCKIIPLSVLVGIQSNLVIEEEPQAQKLIVKMHLTKQTEFKPGTFK